METSQTTNLTGAWRIKCHVSTLVDSNMIMMIIIVSSKLKLLESLLKEK